MKIKFVKVWMCVIIYLKADEDDSLSTFHCHHSKNKIYFLLALSRLASTSVHNVTSGYKRSHMVVHSSTGAANKPCVIAAGA